MNAATIYPIAETAPTPVTSAAESHPTPSRNHSMKAVYFFSHDQNARHDAKISAMRSRYGAEGYGRYWIVIEMLAEEGGHKLLLDECTWDALAMQMQCTSEQAQQFVGDCISRYRLLDSDGESFWSESLLRRLTRRDEVIDKRRNAAKKRWSPIPDDTHAMQMHSTSNAFAMQSDANEMKGDEMKGNESVSEDAHAREGWGDRGGILTDPGVVGVNYGDGELIAGTELLARRIVANYHLPDAAYEPVLAWIETHDNKAPSKHDAGALLKRVERSAPEVVTLAIRRMGNAGRKSINSLDEILTPMVHEWRKSQAVAQPTRGDA